MSNGVVTVAVDEFLRVVDGSGVVVQWRRQAQELVGCTAEEVVGPPVAHLVTGVAAGLVAMRGRAALAFCCPAWAVTRSATCGCGPCGAGTALWDGCLPCGGRGRDC
jgi:hypothetical protein